MNFLSERSYFRLKMKYDEFYSWLAYWWSMAAITIITDYIAWTTEIYLLIVLEAESSRLQMSGGLVSLFGSRLLLCHCVFIRFLSLNHILKTISPNTATFWDTKFNKWILGNTIQSITVRMPIFKGTQEILKQINFEPFWQNTGNSTNI